MDNQRTTSLSRRKAKDLHLQNHLVQACILSCLIRELLKLSWSMKVVSKRFNIKGKTKEFQADEVVFGGQFQELKFNLQQYILLSLMLGNIKMLTCGSGRERSNGNE